MKRSRQIDKDAEFSPSKRKRGSVLDSQSIEKEEKPEEEKEWKEEKEMMEDAMDLEEPSKPEKKSKKVHPAPSSPPLLTPPALPCRLH